MRFKLFPLFVIVLVCAYSTAAQTVVESESAVVLRDRSANVSLAVLSDAPKTVTVSLELLDRSGTVRSAISADKPLLAGKNACDVSLPLDEKLLASDAEVAWYRLRYKVGDTSGIISFSQLVTDLFELRTTAADEIVSGMNYRVRTRAINPFTLMPLEGVAINVTVDLDLKNGNDKKLRLTSAGVTDADGFSSTDFRIPSQTDLDGDGEVTVTGKKDGVDREATENIRAMTGDVQFLMLTDKPIYQPEQTIDIRGILLKGIDERTVLAGTDVEFRITDEDDTVLYREKVRSSEFGIASASWRIPSNAKLGSYWIQVRNSEDDQIAGRRIRISRYDLPNFTVAAKPSKSYYVAGDSTAEVEVSAAYLFGKPVTRGHVRVVEEESREWNWKDQRYDIEEGQVNEGETETDGKYHAKFDLKEKQDDLRDESSRFRDVHFAAYFSDPTTNRTEQRRFDVRITREPIHVYFIGETYTLNTRLPIQGYFSTFYADGTPAECDVEIRASVEDEKKFKPVAHVMTNSFGAARVSMPRPNIGDDDDNLDFKVIARDRNGKRGTWTDTIRFEDDEEEILLTSDKTIYKPGEPIKVSVKSSKQTGTVFVDVVNGLSVVDSRFASLRDGKAQVEIPYGNAFRGALTLAAFTEKDDKKDGLLRTSRGVIFPTSEGVKVNADFDKPVYKPNEQATVKFGVTNSSGATLESALGIVVLDRAVEERASSDADFGNMWSDYAGFLGYGASFGGVNLKDLNEIDLTKPVSEEMQLVAELILRDKSYYPDIFHSPDYDTEPATVFADAIKTQFAPVRNALISAYDDRSYAHPTDDASLRNILSASGINFDQLHDPWGVAYRPYFSVDRAEDKLRVLSAGPDKKFDTGDDFEAFSIGFNYFTPVGKTIDAVLKHFHERTSEYVRDRKALLTELGLRELPDRFGRPYKLIFEPEGRFLKLRVRSAGRDGKFDLREYYGDDFDVWTSRVDIFQTIDDKIRHIEGSLKQIPMNESDFRASLRAGGLDLDKIRDGYGRPVYVTVGQRSRYWDKVTLGTVQNYGDPRQTERSVITPVSQKIIEFAVRSSGKDGKIGTYDDLTLTDVVHVLSEQTRETPKPQPAPAPAIQPAAYFGPMGSIAGVVRDQNGAAIANATVTATGKENGISKKVTTSASGDFFFVGLSPDNYSIKVSAANFKDAVLQNVQLKSGETVQADVTLTPGSVSETVNVTSEGEINQTTNSSVGVVVTDRKIFDLPKSVNASNLLLLRPGALKVITKSGTSDDDSTPRVREYFPETLLWQPDVVTDANGKAQLNFRVADSITTWKMYAIASTKNGQIGVAEKEVTAFQPFFVDLDPPKFLTEGDEIYLPSQVRNYTDKAQRADVTMDRADWFSMLGPDKQQVDVKAGDSQNAVFGFKADTAIKDGKQRVTAIAQTDSDAIEKPVTVRPNGQEVVHTDSNLFTGEEKLNLTFPANALPRTQKAELKIYPNLYSQISESIEGLLERPYGCGEQTISSTYPNLMVLRFAKPDSALAFRAKKYLQKGYERLLGYQAPDGGFTYWGGKSASDVALTAYAIRFLSDAGTKIDVDQEVIKKAEGWLVKQQHADGSWLSKRYWQTAEDPSTAKLTTTYVARSLAMQKGSDVNALTKALAYLKSRNAEIDEPYALALFGLASLDAGDSETAASVAKTLESMAIAEGSSDYWNLETNTPFYGWGTAGRIETTALVTQLLIRTDQKDPSTHREDLINKATLFLLKNKDRYGVWYSTQTTMNVLDAFIAAIGTGRSPEAQKLDVLINGEPLKTIDVAPDQIEAVTLDLTGKVSASNNNIEVRSSGSFPVMLQLVASHYIDWKDSDASNVTVNRSRALSLDYKCDKTNAAIMEEVTCSVKAERIGFQGYGMLLAEIGTPPGADVSRESLENAIGSDWSISHYEILPDRIVLYMWSKAGGTNFSFKFRPRYGINAQTPSSVVYDYYNPEAQATVAPLRFLVK